MADNHSLSTSGLSSHTKEVRSLSYLARCWHRMRKVSFTVCGRLVSSQLSIQLPQNSGARGKGNWPSEVSRLQYLTGCLISWRYDMISNRATKSKANTRNVVARARNWEIRSTRSKGSMPARVSPELAQDSTSTPTPPSQN
jgi:hypothetical protein